MRTELPEEDNKSIVLFDGVCNLCNASVQFVIARDPKGKFKFASLQSATGINFLKEFNLSTDQLHSIILITQNKIYDRSSAALRIAKSLSGLWPMLYIFIIIPPFIRNFVYDWIARNRYKWFGRQNECMIPTPELKSRFIDY